MRARLAGALALWTIAMVGASAHAADETIEQSVCRTIEGAAAAEGLPVGFFTRLIWRESRFRATAVSPAGAQGIAQFMPGTAAMRDLADPFDPETAIPESAEFLGELRDQFGNLGLAAAGYNAGPNRVQGWLDRGGFLPLETQDYVFAITGHTAEAWAEDPDAEGRGELDPDPDPDKRCVEVVALLKTEDREIVPIAPWGVQLAGNHSKQRALASFARMRDRFPAILAGVQTIVIGTRMAGRGPRPFYRVRVPAETRAEGNAFCQQLRAAGGACVVYRN